MHTLRPVPQARNPPGRRRHSDGAATARRFVVDPAGKRTLLPRGQPGHRLPRITYRLRESRGELWGFAGIVARGRYPLRSRTLTSLSLNSSEDAWKVNRLPVQKALFVRCRRGAGMIAEMGEGSLR
jgi:hypothetical protein